MISRGYFGPLTFTFLHPSVVGFQCRLSRPTSLLAYFDIGALLTFTLIHPSVVGFWCHLSRPTSLLAHFDVGAADRYPHSPFGCRLLFTPHVTTGTHA